MERIGTLLALSFLTSFASAQGYRTPPEVIQRCIDAAPTPGVDVGPRGKVLLLTERESLPSIAVQSRPILRLAGVRFDPATHGGQRGARTHGMSFQRLADGVVTRVAVPSDADLGAFTWSPVGSHVAFTNTTDDRIELWVANVEDGSARRIEGVTIADVVGRAVQWMPDGRTLLVQMVAPGELPAAPRVPGGPVIQETKPGVHAQVRTFQDLLENAYDADLFEFYARSQLALVDVASGDVSPVGDPAIHASVSPSPNGAYLLATVVRRPFSYLVPYFAFPQTTVLLDRAGALVSTLVERGSTEDVPIGGVATGRRSFAWIPTEDATLTFVEALDGGDSRAPAAVRDQVYQHAAPFENEPVAWFRTTMRFGGIAYVDDGERALVSERDRTTRKERLSLVNPRVPTQEAKLLWERSSQDAYGDPGRPVTVTNARGDRVVHSHAGSLFLTGRGATPQGDRPFLDRWDLASGKKERLFTCREGRYESVDELLEPDGSVLLVHSESPEDYPNHYVLHGEEWKAVTAFRDPVAELVQGVEKRMLKYERKDGVPLSGTLYLPPGYEEGRRLPVLVWAYPREYASKKDAGQVRGSTSRYTRMRGTSPLLLALLGYAVLDDASMPIIGPGDSANDDFIEQLVANAEAAIETLVACGVGDRYRMAIAGHSYGAFMTANLLAHSDLFRAGIARSGAYNRTLTPFGFQNEQRTFWQAPQIYYAMSPFMHANDIDEPLLMIHGEADNNSGTFPIQSERLYHAIKGHGGHARLVMLPFESHGYAARESVMHTMAETVAWLDAYVKGAKPASSDPTNGD